MGAAVFAALVVLLCVGLFIAGVRMDESTIPRKPQAVDAAPLRRSLAALQFENAKLRRQINATFEENMKLRAQLHLDLPRNAALKDYLPAASSSSTAAAADRGVARPSALSERLKDSIEFNKERAQAVAGPNKQIILTFVNKIRLDFATTWVAHVRALGLTNWLVGATDRPALKALRKAGIACFDMSTNLPEGEWPWGSPSFKALGPHKIELIFKALSWGFELVITDIDALVLREPFAFMARWLGFGLGLGIGLGVRVRVRVRDRVRG